MGLLDGVKSLGSSLVNKARELENTVEDTAATAEKAVVKTATDAFDAVKNAPVALANEVGAAANALPSAAAEVAHTWTGALSDAATHFGSALTGAGTAIENGSRALSPYVPFAAEGVAIGAATKSLGVSVGAIPSEAASLVSGAEDLARRGEDFLQRAEGVANQGIAAAKGALDTARAGVDAIKNGVEGFVSEVSQAVDYGHNIDELKDGDTYTLGVGGAVTVEGLKGYGKGSIEVTKNDAGKYVVSADGELGGGVFGEVGGSVGAKLDAEASATLGVGGRMEMTFDTPEEAKRATGILLKQAASSAAMGEGNSILPGAGIVAGAALAPSSDDYKFLGDHVSAVELRGNVAGEVDAGLGVKGVAGLMGDAGLKAEDAVRIEFKDDKGEPKDPPELVVRQTLSGEANLGAGIYGYNDAKESSGGEGAFIGASGEAKIQIEQRFKLPTGIDSADLLKDPKGTLSRAAGQMVKSEQDKITLGLDVSGAALGNGGGLDVEASYTGDAADLRNGAIDLLTHGDLSGALKTLNKPDSMDVSVEPYTTLGVACSPSISLMGFGVDLDFQANRRDVADPPARAEIQGSPSQVIDDLNKRLAPYAKYLRPAAA